MALEVAIRDGESQDSLIRRFQRSIQMEGILISEPPEPFFLKETLIF